MKKLAPFRPSLVTRAVFPSYTDPSVINEGECFIWAYSAFLMFKDVELWDVNCHAFVRYRGRFYDSENHRGAEDWRDLKATNHNTTQGCRYTANEFKRVWAGQPRRFRTTWSEIEREARRILRREQS